MESSKVFEGAEECHSSESGWTMYIGSPGDDDDDGQSDDRDYDDDDGSSGGGDDMNANHEDDSDDSMASDASSGLSKPNGNEQVRHTNISHFKGAEEDEGCSNSKCASDKTKAKRQLKKQMAERKRKEEKEDVMFMEKRRVSTSAQSYSKVIRKNIWHSPKRN